MRCIILIFITLLTPLSTSAKDDDFPVPELLLPNMSFWKKVYLEISTLQGFLHDPDDIDTIYTIVDLPPVSPREQNRWLRNEKAKVRALLQECKRDLTANDLCKKLPNHWTPQRIEMASRQIRFQLGQKDRFYAGLRRSGRYLKKIREVFREAGLPEDLGYLPHVESSFDYKAHSRVGASGIWQFIQSTGRRYMKINYMIDERRDPLLATYAAAKLLKSNYEMLGAWPLAITAYNHGPAGIRRLSQRIGTTDIAEIIQKENSRSFGFASRNFYAQFLVAREIAGNHEKYIKDVAFEQPIEFKVFETTTFLPAKETAAALNLSLEELKYFNPSLRDPVWQGLKFIPKGFPLKLPPDRNPDELLAQVAKSRGKQEQIATQWHSVQRGDSLWAIARFNRQRLEQILALNNLSMNSVLRTGQIIQLPTGAEPPLPPSASSKPPPPPPDLKAVVAPKEEPLPDLPSIPTPLLAFAKQYESTAPPPVEEAEQQKVDEEAAEEEAEIAENAVPSPVVGPVQAPLYRDMSVRMAGLANLNEKTVGNSTWIHILVSPDEAMSLFIEWSGSSTSAIMKANNLRRADLATGQKIWIPLGKNVNSKDFETRRLEYHKSMEDDFFASYEVVDTLTHEMKRGEQIWNLCVKKYQIPIWLFYRFNQTLELSQIQAGSKLVIPVVRPVAKGT